MGVPDIQQLGNHSELKENAESRELFTQLAHMEVNAPNYKRVRNRLIEIHSSMIFPIARKFRSNFADLDDLIQVGSIGLIKAVERFDPYRGTPFRQFANFYVSGEIKRFYRDSLWAVHVPRTQQERAAAVAKADETLLRSLSRKPTSSEISEYLEITETQVNQARVAANGFSCKSIFDSGSSGVGSELMLGRLTGYEDPTLDLIDDILTLKNIVCATINGRERAMLYWRFYEDMTQEEIGVRLGISQMQVSRSLHKIFSCIRKSMNCS